MSDRNADIQTDHAMPPKTLLFVYMSEMIVIENVQSNVKWSCNMSFCFRVNRKPTRNYTVCGEKRPLCKNFNIFTKFSAIIRKNICYRQNKFCAVLLKVCVNGATFGFQCVIIK